MSDSEEEYSEEFLENELECISCDFIATRKDHFDRHCKSKSHIFRESEITGIPLTKDLLMELFEHYCEKCDYYTNEEFCWKNHLTGNKHNMEKEEYKNFRREQSKNSTEKGDKLEQYFCEIYRECKDIEDVKNIGHTGNKYDIIIKYKDEQKYRAVQSKSLQILPDEYKIGIGNSKYDDDTLIISSDPDRKFFVIIPFLVIKNRSSSISISYEKGTKYYPYCYDTVDKFKKALFELSKKSFMIENETDSLTDTQKQEYESLIRLEQKCGELKIEFKSKITNSTTTDCFINNKKIQCKTCSITTTKLYDFWLGKSGGNKKPKIPYTEIDDIDFFIFEITNDKYMNNFYIIPKLVLIDEGFIKTEKNKGQVNIWIAPPDYEGYRSSMTNWTLKYLNRFDYFKNEIKNENKLVSLDGRLKKERLEYKISKPGQCHHHKIGSIVGKKIAYRLTNYEKSKNKFQVSSFHRENKSKTPIKKGMYDYFIVEIGKYKGNYYVFPENILIEKKIIATKKQSGTQCFYIMDPNIKENNWSLQYLNKFDQFKS
jgi:hypothetical protein